MSKLGIATSETHARPRFTSHTQSSLMKKRTPMKFKKKSSSIKDMNRIKKPQENVILRSNRRRSNIVKQSRSMQMMVMIFKQQQDRRTTVFPPNSELMETSFRLEKSFVSLQSDLIKDISHDFKRCASPAKLATLHDEPTKVVDEFEKLMENSHFQDRTNRIERDDSENIRVSSEYCAIDVVNKLQSRSSEEEPADSHREVEVLHREIESEKKSNDFPNKDCSEIETQVHQQGVNNATNRRRPRKFWINRKAGAWNEHVDRTCRTDLQNSKSTKHINNPQDNWSANDKPAVNDNVITWKRSGFQKNSYQRAWRPAGVSKTWTTESATSLQPMSQKFQLAEKSVLSKNKHSSTEHE